MTDFSSSTERSELRQLLPCPFCGGRANVYRNEVDFVTKWSVGCGDCNCNMDVCEDTPADAAVEWNNRAPQSADVAQGQSGCGEPVAWRWRHPAWAQGSWNYQTTRLIEPDPQLIVEPLFNMPHAASNAYDVKELAERLADVVMMLDAPDAYNRSYVAVVCRLILSSVSSTDGDIPPAHRGDARE